MRRAAASAMDRQRTPFRDAQHVRDWSVKRGIGFWVGKSRGLKFFTWFLNYVLPACFSPVPGNLALVDVGAGIHGLGKSAMIANRIHSDDSDALMFLWTFHHNATVWAFEANAEKADELKLASYARHTTREYASHLNVRTLAVGRTVGEVLLHKCGYPSTFDVFSLELDPAERRRPCTHTVRVHQTTLDSEFPVDQPGAEFILYVKIDVEGATLDALAGMSKRLAAHATPLVSVEYALSWSPEFGRRAAVPYEARGALQNSLDGFQRRYDLMGYDTFLVHAEGSGKVVTLVPVSGKFWHPDLEICANRSLFYGNWGAWCWNDALLVSRDAKHACVRRWVWEHFVGVVSRGL